MEYRTESAEKTTRDAKIDFFTRFLLGVASVCPLIFFISCGGLFVAEGNMSTALDRLTAVAAPVGYLSAGFVGCLASLFALVKSKKRKARRFVLYFSAVLFVLNLLIVPPVFYVATRFLNSI